MRSVGVVGVVVGMRSVGVVDVVISVRSVDGDVRTGLIWIAKIISIAENIRIKVVSVAVVASVAVVDFVVNS